MPIVLWVSKEKVRCTHVKNLRWIIQRRSKVDKITIFEDLTIAFRLKSLSTVYIVRFSDYEIMMEFIQKRWPNMPIERSEEEAPNDDCTDYTT